MTAGSVTYRSVYQIRNTVPDSKVQMLARLREVNAIQRAKHGAGILPISISEPARAQRVDDGNGQQCRFHTVAGDIEEIKRKPLRIHPVITEPISAKLRRSRHEPVR